MSLTRRSLAVLTLLVACNATQSDLTDAPTPAETAEFRVEEFAVGLDRPWALEFLPDGRILLTERPGRLRIVGLDGALSEPLANVPEVYAQDQGGLLDVALAHDFANSSRIYLSFAEPREGGSGTSVAAATLVLEGTPRLEDVSVIFRQLPTFANGKHFGSRIAVADDGALFVGLGERFTDETREQAQTLDNHLGKVVRIRGDGSVPDDNPFVDEPGALPEIWSIGHRNIQSAAIHPETRALWTVEHGPKGGDEVNLPEAGKNYGWPRVSYGVDYDGSPVGNGESSAPEFVEPKYYWVPSIAPSGAMFYTGAAFPAWQGDLFVGALVEEHLSRLELEDGRVVGEERLLGDLGQRIRDVAQGPDGLVYVLTDKENAKILRLAPKSE
ncbi:PQQ-dependent sugar dehydrogenase [Nannocystis bainbridge]|uniref:PQQ-dependent sugar dehydrogenase n=1 Tax=Nannocystis bainbridge TaxID=2995303 RepID=A0ABT5DV58_9BACT|nr:PQQ-dependent sugar dehydrogenase [Nannocystis bainbridge]MDC0717456.1 PQQ-dependent sugar dehydrogenase [Nannocystis bainbridge]